MQQRLEEATTRLNDHSEPFSILFLDVDNFKQINDCHGHDGGDYALQHVAHTLRMMVGSEALLARWGGEEFFVLLPQTESEGAQLVAELLRESLAQGPIRSGEASLHITVTIGAATAMSAETPAELVRRADEALYRGKEMGRNRVAWG